jgi:uncharacterized protein (DUF433 family)
MAKAAELTAVAPRDPDQDTKTEYPHIVRRPGVVGGRPRIAGSRIPVWQIASRWNADETLRDILETYPHISPAAVHSALAYYWDHKDEVDAEIEEHRPANVLAALRADPNLVEEKPGVFRGKAPEELARERA